MDVSIFSFSHVVPSATGSWNKLTHCGDQDDVGFEFRPSMDGLLVAIRLCPTTTYPVVDVLVNCPTLPIRVCRWDDNPVSNSRCFVFRVVPRLRILCVQGPDRETNGRMDLYPVNMTHGLVVFGKPMNRSTSLEYALSPRIGSDKTTQSLLVSVESSHAEVDRGWMYVVGSSSDIGNYWANFKSLWALTYGDESRGLEHGAESQNQQPERVQYTSQMRIITRSVTKSLGRGGSSIGLIKPIK